MRNVLRGPAHWLLALGFGFSLFATAASADTLDQVKARGSLKWGGDSSGGGPYIYQGDDNQLTGFEYELAQYLADKLGVKSEYVNWEWEMLPEILDRGSIDVVLNGYEWSEEREQLWSSTIPYYIYKLELMARKDDGSIAAWDDLTAKAGQPRKRVGVLAGSAAARYMEQRFGEAIELKKYPEVTSVMGLVEQGQLDATVQDVPIAIHYGRDFPKLHGVGEPQAAGYYVAYVRHGDEALRERLNDGIRTAIADGTLQRIYEKYGIWNADQERLAEVAKDWPPKVEAAASRWANFGSLCEPPAAGGLDDGDVVVSVDAAGDAARAVGGDWSAVWSVVGAGAARRIRGVSPRHSPALAVVCHLLSVAAAHGVQHSGVLGGRAGAGDQLLGLRGGKLPGRPARDSARADGGGAVAGDEHADGAAPRDHSAGGADRDSAGDQ